MGARRSRALAQWNRGDDRADHQGRGASLGRVRWHGLALSQRRVGQGRQPRGHRGGREGVGLRAQHHGPLAHDQAHLLGGRAHQQCRQPLRGCPRGPHRARVRAPGIRVPVRGVPGRRGAAPLQGGPPRVPPGRRPRGAALRPRARKRVVSGRRVGAPRARGQLARCREHGLGGGRQPLEYGVRGGPDARRGAQARGRARPSAGYLRGARAPRGVAGGPCGARHPVRRDPCARGPAHQG